MLEHQATPNPTRGVGSHADYIGRLGQNSSKPQEPSGADAELRGYFKASVTALGELFDRARHGRPLCTTALRELAVLIVDQVTRLA
jgi:hypothetical protein